MTGLAAAIYARKSTDQAGVADDAKSVTRQIAQASAFAEARGWIVDDSHVYIDDGVSGAEFAHLWEPMREHTGNKKAKR